MRYLYIRHNASIMAMSIICPPEGPLDFLFSTFLLFQILYSKQNTVSYCSSIDGRSLLYQGWEYPGVATRYDLSLP